MDYGSGSSTGATVATSSSFKDGIDVKVSMGAVAGQISADFNYSQTDTTSVSVTKSTSTSYDIKVTGPPADGVDHDYDQFLLWLNPLVNVTIDTQNNVKWALGLGGDEMIFQYVTAGQLKDPSSMPAGMKQLMDAAGMGDGDCQNLLESGLNPFFTVPAFGGLPPEPIIIDPTRYLPVPAPFAYEPPSTASASPDPQTYALTNSTDQTATTTKQTQLGVSATITAGWSTPFTASLQATASFQWTHTSTFSTETKSSQSASLTIGGPSFGYSGSTNLQVYWDTMYGTFMFVLA